MISHVAFVQMIPILGTPRRQDQFLASDGWTIEENEHGVTLSCAESQNVAAVPRFGVVGVGYCIEVENYEQTEEQGPAAGREEAGPIDLPRGSLADAVAPVVAHRRPKGRPRKARHEVEGKPAG